MNTDNKLCETRDNNNRIIYLDYLRVLSTFAVIMLHVSSQNWSNVNVNSFEWQVFNFFDGAVRWSVPIFIMISGTLFLNKDILIKKIYSKYILRLAMSFFVWSLIYVIFDPDTKGLKNKLLMLIHGHYHMWFILMMIGVYMCIPLIKQIIENKKLVLYYFLLAFVFGFAYPTLAILIHDFTGGIFVKKIVYAINDTVNIINMNMLFGYGSYFILGYYLSHLFLTKQKRIFVYILGLIGFALTVFLDSFVALKINQACSNYYAETCVNVLLQSVAVFIFFKYINFGSTTLNALVEKLSKYSFGAYLVHVLVIEKLNMDHNLNTLCFNPVLSVMFISFIVFIISFFISWILNQIPVIKKYVV